MKHIIARRFLVFAVFILGFSTMTMELVASRLMAPYFGTSYVVWTNLIGIFLGALSLGYFLGGRIADRGITTRIISQLLFVSAMILGVLLFAYRPLLSIISGAIPNLPVSSGLSSFLLFAPINVLYGVLTPLIVKLHIRETKHEGSSVGNLYAISALGNIAGVFMTGYVFIPRMGVHVILFMLVVLHLFLFAASYGRILLKTMLIVFIFAAVTALSFAVKRTTGEMVFETDTLYNHIQVFMANPGRLMKVMKINNDYSSGAFPDSRELAFEYTKFFRLSTYINPGIQSALMIGGGAYSYPMQYLLDFPKATMTVVELDPGVTETARKEFRLRPDNRLHIVHEDGRSYMNRDRTTYDALFVDAFDNNAVPYPLTTVEAVRTMSARLNRNGFVMLNLIGTLTGQGSTFVRAEYDTYRSVFPSVYLIPVHGYGKLNQLQAMILVAFKKETVLQKDTDSELFKPMLKNIYPMRQSGKPVLLSDDFAPVEYYVSKTY